jgi:16S rRNA processing protein RimM
LTDNRNAEKSVEIGVVGRPHGVRGAFRLFLYNPSSQIIQTVESVRLAPKEPGAAPSEHRVAAVSRAGKHCIVSLEGFERREQAEEITGARLLVPRSALPHPEDGEVYVEDLMGIDVFQGPLRLGSVAGSREQGGVEVLSVVGESDEIQIPLVTDFVVAIDLAGGRMEVENTDDLPRTPRHARSAERV